MSKAFLKWSPAVPFKLSDKIISSKAKEKNQIGFKPSYENEPQEHIQLLLSNEYMRIWFKERAVYEKDTYTREKIIKEESKIKRRFVQRMMTYRKPTKNQFIDEMVEKRKLRTSKSPKEQTESNYERMKYKPQCISKVSNKDNMNEKNNKSNREEKKITENNKDTNNKNENEQVLEVEIECGCECKKKNT